MVRRRLLNLLRVHVLFRQVADSRCAWDLRDRHDDTGKKHLIIRNSTRVNRYTYNNCGDRTVPDRILYGRVLTNQKNERKVELRRRFDGFNFYPLSTNRNQKSGSCDGLSPNNPECDALLLNNGNFIRPVMSLFEDLPS